MSGEIQLGIPELDRLPTKPLTPLEILASANRDTLRKLTRQPVYEKLIEELGSTHIIPNRTRIIVPTKADGVRITVTALTNILAASESEPIDGRLAFMTHQETIIYHGRYGSIRKLPEGTRIGSHGPAMKLRSPRS